ncbi:DUF6247 family protein [Actinomycetospora termitidis]|uniref:DUF6247 family protein n=1 Tax=Actinomycetospora termitidis TaxID=3053470 RepID=A0ABT7MCH3_9PSEU|nr:DUF6247 family protein [Actinomycetospora sp. Odt1-22]MDL5158371.1 DUF6247 family protein [Actinomycetospora sp. Odt1-22]
MTPGAPDDRAHPHPLLPGATPATIHTWLATAEDRAGFVAEYDDALERARRELDISGVHEVIERWRRVALLQSDPAGFRHVVRYAAELATGAASPDDEPLEVTRRKAGI